MTASVIYLTVLFWSSAVSDQQCSLTLEGLIVGGMAGLKGPAASGSLARKFLFQIIKNGRVANYDSLAFLYDRLGIFKLI